MATPAPKITEKTTIRILPNHITDSDISNAGSCMVAEALKDQLWPDANLHDDNDVVGVDYDEISLYGDLEPSQVFREHSTLSQRIRSFDDGNPIRPFEFDLNPDGTTSAPRDLPGYVPVANTKVDPSDDHDDDDDEPRPF